MIAWINHFLWFVKESYSFMQGGRNLRFWMDLIPFSIQHANFMVKWDKMTAEQRDEWYMLADRSLDLRW